MSWLFVLRSLLSSSPFDSLAMTSRSTSNSWLGSLAQPSAFDPKFKTVTLGSANRNRSRPGLFDEDLPSRSNSRSRSKLDDELQELQGLGNDVGWSITVAEGPKARSRSRKPDPVLTVYCTTPTASLTLSRKTSELLEFESRLRAQFPDRIPVRKLPSSATPSTPKKRNVLASLTRTLSPSRRGPASFTSFGAAGKDARGSAEDAKELGAILTHASLDATIRAHAAWTSFFNARSEDLESARVERRVKRARSDQTMHLAPAPLTAGDSPIELGVVRSDRQDSSIGTETSLLTDEVIKPSEEERRLSALFDVPDVPPTANIEVENTPPAPEEEVDLGEEVRRGASVMMEDAPSLHEPEPVEQSVNELFSVPSRPSTAPEPVESTAPSSPSPSDAPPEEPTAVVEDKPAPSSSVSPSPSPSPVRPSPRAKGKSKGKGKTLSPPQADVDSQAMSRSMSDLASSFEEKKPAAVTIDSFELLRVLGKGCAGKVLLVKEKKAGTVLALKAITKRHVLAHRELLHTRTEQTVLKRCARDKLNPFVVRLHYSFHDADTLYLALDFHGGGDLATQLARWGRLGRDRARFYISEIIEGVEGLHKAGIIYRDLKPENVLLDRLGHIVLTDFGLSYAFPRQPASTTKDGLPQPHWLSGPSRSASTPPATTWGFGQRETTSTFCGTAEYLAPEVLLGEAYSYEVDIWSAGTMLYEMLAGITPFYAEDHATMYRRVLHDDLAFDDYRIFDDDTKALLRGMLQRDPLLRMNAARVKRSRYFAAIDFQHIFHRRYVPPFIPTINPHDPADVSQFDDMFLSMPAQVRGDPDDEPGGDRELPEGEPQAEFDEQGKSVWDGYSYAGRDSASIHRKKMAEEDEASVKEEEEDEEEDDEEETSEEEEEEEEEDDEELTPEDSRSGFAPAVEEEKKTIESVDAPPASDATMDDGTPSTTPSTVEEDVETPIADHTNFLTSTPPAPPPAPHTRETSSDADASLDIPAVGDLTLSSIASNSTIATSLAPDSPTLIRSRQISARSNLAPLAEERPKSSTSAEVLVEELEDNSDSEWDVVEAGKGQLTSVRNGGREATFFARGIKDRYRLVLAPLNSPMRPRSRSSRPPSSSSMQSGISSLSPTTSFAADASASRPIGGMRRLASVRSSTSAGGNGSKSSFLRGKQSQRSLGEPASSKTAPPSPRVDTKLFKRGMSASTSVPNGLPDNEATPRKAGAFKKFAKSAFLSTGGTNGTSSKV
ncbi:hypothetical protein JCM8547_007881 [Rhodosporidiobolus lusitaniae]